ncbi:HEXXH motif-containing putative peptide modification protein [Massilia sp. erpn]|uniref:aKG-HExxH-type peptide beta-hydroxylase n=1 Tax=Massilia sp. erpn TaxID=2738142 RepID=UPI002103B5F0|nr:HEXXH motif-containing putative peptide modification protein [Massilia sp. erpn]UTY59474.1 hypothetical protein HPQ68_21230 [Massilia sp. erpn]
MKSALIRTLAEESIAQFNPDDSHLAAVKENIKWYSSINMMYGALPAEPLPPLPPTAIGPIDPRAAEAEDKRRQLAAGPAEAVATEPETLPSLQALLDENRYAPFDVARNVANQVRAIVAITGYLPEASSLKRSYIASLNAIQKTSIPCKEQIVVSFHNPVLQEELRREGLISYAQQQYYSPDEELHIAGRISDALSFIKAVDERLHDAIQSMLGAIVCVRREGSSGTVSSMVGLIWLNPNPSWTMLDFAENIVHEYIHNTIFLADLVEKIFITPHWYAPDDGLVVSAIKKYPRGVNIAFHSLYVAIGLAIFMANAKQLGRAEQLTSGLRETMLGLKEKSERFLSGFGHQLLERVDVYAPAHA